jgi:hypothetical protein
MSKMRMRYFSATLLLLLQLGTVAAYADSVRVGNHYFQSTTLSSTPSVIVTAAANVAGIEITTCQLGLGSGTAVNIIATYPDATQRTIYYALSPSVQSATCPYPIYLPAGVSLSAVEGGGSGDTIYMTYNLPS